MAYLRMARQWDVKEAHYFPLCVYSGSRVICFLVCWSFNPEEEQTLGHPQVYHSSLRTDKFSNFLGWGMGIEVGVVIITPSGSKVSDSLCVHSTGGGNLPTGVLPLQEADKITTQWGIQNSFSHTPYCFDLKARSMFTVEIHKSEIFTF